MPSLHSLVAAGYCVVDVSADHSTAAPGGTALNVAEAISSLGFAASIAGTIGRDAPGRYAKGALSSNGVDVTQLRLDPSWTTPVLVQAGTPTSPEWRFHCPHCGTRFAKFRPSPVAHALEVVEKRSAPSVYFFDRTSLFSLTLAEMWREAGSLVVFEPSTVGQPHLFARATQLAHIVKFSRERRASVEPHLGGVGATLVETRGADGAEIRFGSTGRSVGLGASRARAIIDSAGAGDWTTAGMIAGLVQSVEKPDWAQVVADERDMSDAVSAGQRLGLVACSWSGARPPSWPLPSTPRAFGYRFFCPAHQPSVHTA